MRRQDALHALLDPRCLGQRLALGAVPVAAGVVGRPGQAAGVAYVHVAAEDLCPADLDGPHGIALLRQERVLLAVHLAVGAEDVRDLQARPALLRRGGSPLVLVHSLLPEEGALLGPDQIEWALRSPDVPLGHPRIPAVVWIDAWPSSRWMVRMSSPVSRRWVAKQCRSECGVIRFVKDKATTAFLSVR